MRTSIRIATATVTAASLGLLLTACGGGEKGGDKGKDAPKASASASASAAPDAKALSAAELEKLIVEKADLKGYQVEQAKAADLAKPGDIVTDKAACLPLAEAMSSIAIGNAPSSARRVAVETPKTEKGATGAPDGVLDALGAPATAVTLGSHDGGGAQAALALLKTAGTECAGGFTATVGSEKTKITKVAPETVSAGEEAVAFTVTTDMEGAPWTSKVVAFRQGNTLASFFVYSLVGKVDALPKTVIDAQAAKLG
ncbi:hypothetical protein ACF09C_32485 [Streptomyces sp. NPDC014870]|uniref:hypothetical protein n=1 Tax=Streptomyces sp. NPDC014870 TaxID=3364925 RepID=UPI0036FF8F71